MKNSTSDSFRKKAFDYNIKLQVKKMKICKTAFISLHGISPNRLRKFTDLKICDKTPVDMRGKKTISNVIPGEVCTVANYEPAGPATLGEGAIFKPENCFCLVQLKVLHGRTCDLFLVCLLLKFSVM